MCGICHLCGTPFFGSPTWGHTTCGDCIAELVQASLTGSLFGERKPAKRAQLATDLTMQVEELSASKVSNGQGGQLPSAQGRRSSRNGLRASWF